MALKPLYLLDERVATWEKFCHILQAEVQRAAKFGLRLENPEADPVTGVYHPSCGRPFLCLLLNVGLNSSSCSDPDPCELLSWIHNSTATFEERKTAFSRWASYYYALTEDTLALLIMDHERPNIDRENSSNTMKKSVEYANEFMNWSIFLGLWDGTLAKVIEVQLWKCQGSWLPCDGRPPSQVIAVLEHLRTHGYLDVLNSESIVWCLVLPLHLKVIKVIGLRLLQVRTSGPWR